MSETSQHLKTWIQDQSQTTNGSDFVFSDTLRTPSLEVLQNGNFPTRKNEEWHYTPLTEVLDRHPGAHHEGQVDKSFIEPFKQAVPDAQLIVFADGRLLSEFSHALDMQAKDGLQIHLLSSLDSDSLEKAEQTIADSKLSDDNIFQHIALGLSREGVFVELKKNSEINKPLHFLFISTNTVETTLQNPVNIIRQGKNSRLKIVQQFVSINSAQAMMIPADYIQLEEGAGLDLYKIGLESEGTDHISNTAVHLDASANINSHQYLLGSKFTRSNMEINFSGSGCDAVLRGIYLGDRKQHLDVRTYIDHAHPHCTSDQHFRGIMDDESRGVFNGLVLVQEGAQKTNAEQSNKNLLLSRDARIDTKPQLEIFADDVKCSHGATVGELDKNALFYLQSRGIGKTEAALMLTRAFATEITQDIQISSLQEYVQLEIEKRLTEDQ